MARFRNTSDDVRFIPEATPSTVEPDGLFDVPDDRADAFEAQPWFAPATPKPTRTKDKE
jgi:hypothetical protein